MSVIAEIEKQALSLPEQDRARLADRLIASLPENFIEDEIEGVLRRGREMDENPETVLSHEEFFKFFEDRPKGGESSLKFGHKLPIMGHIDGNLPNNLERSVH